MTDFQPYLDILPDAQKEIWPLLTPATKLGFVLYGGTAIALQLGHRYSVDFDFFSDRTFEVHQIQGAFPFLKGAEVEQNSENTFTAKTKSGVLLSFFGGISFGRVGTPLTSNDNSVQVASLNDLMATKLKALFDRVECKDYRDISAILQHGVDLSGGLAAARTLYGENFQPGEALKAMTYFKGGDLVKLDMQDREILLDAARKVRTLPEVKILAKSLVAALR